MALCSLRGATHFVFLKLSEKFDICFKWFSLWSKLKSCFWTNTLVYAQFWKDPKRALEQSNLFPTSDAANHNGQCVGDSAQQRKEDKPKIIEPLVMGKLFIPRSQRREGQTPLNGPQNLLWPATFNLSLYIFKKHFSFQLINKLLKGLCLANIVPFGSIFSTTLFFGRWCNPMSKTSKFNGVGECWLLFPQFARCDSQTPSQATATQLLQKNC